MKISAAAAVFAIAYSAGAFLPDAMSPVGFGKAFAANANSGGNGRSGDNDDRGRSADAGSQSGGRSSNGGPASGQGGGGGLLRLLATGSANPSSTGGTAPTAVATGAPLQLLPPQVDTRPVALVTAYVMDTIEGTDIKPGEIHNLLGAGHSYFNSNEQAKLNAADKSRIKRVERYLQANADAQAALTANGGVLPTPQEYADAQAYLEAVAVLADPGSYTQAEIDAANIVINGSALTEATAQAVVDAYEAEAATIAAFEEADNQPYDEARRAVYDAVAEYAALNSP